MDSTTTATVSRPRRDLRARIGAAFGVTRESRAELLARAVDKPADDAATYWFLLAVSTGMSTLGLVLGSGAVVIGAMLVAPLMTPIVELALALLVGASYLLLRSLVRIGVSVVFVAGTAALITLALPLQEPTAEILSRTHPTVLDLLIAVFCALAAGFAVSRASSSAIATASGTAIGIALVPPLCVLGFGIGTLDAEIAGGALLLFIANFCAILLFAGAYFWLVGFEALPPGALHDRAPGGGPVTALLDLLADAVDRGLRSRWHMVFRVGVPLLFFASIATPLTTALQEVSWQVRTRAGLSRILAADPLLADAISSSASVVGGHVSVSAVVVGTPEQAATATERIAPRIAALAGVVPDVLVRPVAQAADAPRKVEVEPAPEPSTALAMLRARVAETVREAWPVDEAGDIADLALEIPAAGPPRVRVAHWGDPVGPAAEAALARAASSRLGFEVRVLGVALAEEPVVADPRATAAWIASLRETIARVRDVESVALCATVPARSRWRDEVVALCAALPPPRVTVDEGRALSFRLGSGGCAGDQALSGSAPGAGHAPGPPAPSR
ncbi:MAG: DUF389 domain-containing protein [Acidobacteria bacterium]|nr:DUF389 domain-containing protein [Acidobacteriota bacterium]